MTTELIILFIISFLAATISGAASFGGALVLLTVLTNVIGIKVAVPFRNSSRQFLST